MGLKKVTVRRYILVALCNIFILLENVAFGKTATQSSNHHSSKWHAGRAIDNCTNQEIISECCIHTSVGNKEAWWKVDLETRIAIEHITIYYRGDYNGKFANRFAGYELYVSNTTNRSQGVVCYRDTSSAFEDVDLNPTHQCQAVGQYVIIYNKRENPKRHDWYDDDAVLELCEVQVIGCPVGTYGNGDCSMNCPTACIDASCHPTSGSCFYCPQEKNGDFFVCENNCSLDCIDMICNRNTGYCKACSNGFYGDKCELECPKMCENPVCDQRTGICGDCKPGYHGLPCDKTCNQNCKGDDCRQIDGACKEGCNAGKYGLLCDQDCPEECKSNIYHRFNGACVECNNGHHGDVCNLKCPRDCERNICEIGSGVCADCVSGKFGFFCEYPCPEDCGENSCGRSDGICAAESSSTAIMAALGCLAGIFFLVIVALIVVILNREEKP